MSELPDKSVNLMVTSPPYNIGIDYGNKYVNGKVVGSKGVKYSDNLPEEQYRKMLKNVIDETRRVLKDDGNMFLINYPKQNAYLRVKYLDRACYEVSDYVWAYNTNVGHSPKRFTTAHRSILHCRKTKYNKFYKDNVSVPYKNPTDKRILRNLANGSKGRMPYDWFYFDLVKNVSREKTFHACQIPQKLSEMLINSCTLPNDNVLVLFGGSGSEVEICKILKRQYISAEIDEKYHKLILDRISTGRIEEKYRLRLKRYEIKNIQVQLKILESQKEYLIDKEKTKPRIKKDN